MTKRTSIRNAIVDSLKQELSPKNSNIYYTDIDMNVTGDNLQLADVESFPAITVTLGPETLEYQPGGFRWVILTLYIRAYVKSEDVADEKLELLLQDIKTFIDTNEDIEYTIITPDGQSKTLKATEMTIQSLTTDEGLLRPMGLGEVSIRVRYQERHTLF